MKTIYYVIFLMFLLLSGPTLTAQLPQLVGTTSYDQNYEAIIYRSNLDGTAFMRTYNLQGISGFSISPAGKLVRAPNNLLYGISEYYDVDDGDRENYIFSYDPVSNILTEVHAFSVDVIHNPLGGLFLASNGILYGTADYNLYSFNPTTRAYNILVNVNNNECTLMQGSDGKLYGISNGGINNTGTIFSYDLSTNTYIKLADFPITFQNPYGKLVQASNGYFYGYATAKTTGYNVVYAFNPSTKAITIIHNFGKKPVSLDNFLVKDNLKSYVIYGASVDAQQGELFSITTTDNFYHKGHAFVGTEGTDPTGGLLNINNNLYGVSANGGNFGYGTIFESPSIGSFKKLHDFAGGTGGSHPLTGLIEVPCTAVPAKPGVIMGNTTPACNTTKKYSIKRISGATSYTWTVPAGAKIIGVASDTIVSIKFGMQSGTVGVKASNACGSSVKRTLNVTVTCSSMQSAITNSETVSGTTVTPNPTTGNVVVHFTSSTSSKYTIHVVDIAGRILLTQEINTVVGNNITQLNLSKLAKGIYYIQLNGEANKQIFKVVLE